MSARLAIVTSETQIELVTVPKADLLERAGTPGAARRQLLNRALGSRSG
jgi:hypothetical protein